jgi:hypothetical protein
MQKLLYHTRLIALIVLTGITGSMVAQETDFGLWNTVDISKKWKNGLTLAFEEEYRLRNNLLTTDKFQSTVELGYKFNPFFSAGVSYTLINYYHPRNDEHAHNYWEFRHRFNVFAEGEYEWNRFTFSLRERLQTTYRILDTLSSAKINPKLILRSKVSLSYNIRGLPLEPYATVEWFNLLNGNVPFSNEKYRLAAGMKYKVNKKWSVKAGYLFAAETDEEDGEQGHILTLGLGYKF